MTDESSVQEVGMKSTVSATVEACFAVAIDLETYPDWVDGMRSVSIKEKDSENRPTLAHFSAESFGRKSEYLLAYKFNEDNTKLSWSLVEGDLVREIEGSYTFTELADGEGTTEVLYELKIDLAVPLPAFVKRRAEDKIVSAALNKFKNRVESP